MNVLSWENKAKTIDRLPTKEFEVTSDLVLRSLAKDSRRESTEVKLNPCSYSTKSLQEHAKESDKDSMSLLE